MCKLIIYTPIIFLFANFSCEKNISKGNSKYNLIVTEIDCTTNETITSFKNVFISYQKGLFEYDFKSSLKTIITTDSRQTESKEDSVTISFIPLAKPIYYKFDFLGNLLKKDSVKNKTSDFIKIDSSNNQADPLFIILNNLSEKYLIDTIVNDLHFKTYKHPHVIKDVAGDIILQLFFIEDRSLITPFSVNNRYPLVSGKYGLAGFIYTLPKENRKLIVLMSDSREITAAEKILCENIYKSISKMKY
ncbi:hypothetical protein [Ferruginibacter sp.]